MAESHTQVTSGPSNQTVNHHNPDNTNGSNAKAFNSQGKTVVVSGATTTPSVHGDLAKHTPALATPVSIVFDNPGSQS